jgi:hypothetical protein
MTLGNAAAIFPSRYRRPGRGTGTGIAGTQAAVPI